MKVISLLALALVLTTSTSGFAASSAWDRAMQLYQKGNYSGALSELKAISSAGADNPSVHYLIGMCYKNLGKPDQARLELVWVASYAIDANTREMAKTALKQVGTVPRLGVGAASATLPTTGSPPAKVLINDSVSQTIRAADKNGWRPCPGKCLNVNTPDWHHEHVDGHADTENWHTFPRSKSPHMATTAHWGEVFEEAADGTAISKGACPTCGGTGWIRSK